MDRKLQRHRADSLRQHGFLVRTVCQKLIFLFSLELTLRYGLLTVFIISLLLCRLQVACNTCG